MINDTKNNIVTVRLDDITVKMMDKIYSDYLIGGTYSNRSKTNKSFIIETAIKLLYTLDFTDEYTFLNTFGSYVNNNYINCNNTLKYNVLKKTSNLNESNTDQECITFCCSDTKNKKINLNLDEEELEIPSI